MLYIGKDFGFVFISQHLQAYTNSHTHTSICYFKPQGLQYLDTFTLVYEANIINKSIQEAYFEDLKITVIILFMQFFLYT